MSYDFDKWNEKIIQEPNELMRKLKSLNINGKTIKNIIVLGIVSDLGNLGIYPDQIEYIKNDDLKEYSRIVRIDDPVIIEFSDGNKLEVDYTDGSTIKIGMNSLPEDLIRYCSKQIDGNIFFSNCINKEIVGFSVEMEDGEYSFDFTGAHGVELDDEQELFISNFKLILNDNTSIKFNPFYDYGEISALKYDVISKISKEELLESILIKSGK